MKNTQKCDAIYDNMNQLNCHLSTFATFWPQELPVNQMQWHKIKKITMRNKKNANTIPDNAMEAT